MGYQRGWWGETQIKTETELGGDSFNLDEIGVVLFLEFIYPGGAGVGATDMVYISGIRFESVAYSVIFSPFSFISRINYGDLVIGCLGTESRTSWRCRVGFESRSRRL